MKKLHNTPVNVSLTVDETLVIFAMFRDGQFVTIPDDLEQKFITAYHEANNAQVKRLEKAFSIVSLNLPITEWEHQNFDQAIEELKELEADLENVAIDLSLIHRTEAIKLALKALETIKSAVEAPFLTDEMETRYQVFSEIYQLIEKLRDEYHEDLQELNSQNELELPLGETIQEGKLMAVKEVLYLLKNWHAITHETG